MNSFVVRVSRAAAVAFTVSAVLLGPAALADGGEIAPPQRLEVPTGVDPSTLELFDRYDRLIPLTVRDGDALPPALPSGAYELRWDGGVQRFTVAPWESEEFGAGVHEGSAITERDATGAYVGTGNSTPVGAIGATAALSVCALALLVYGARRRSWRPTLLGAGATGMAAVVFLGFVAGDGAIRPSSLTQDAFAAVRTEVQRCESGSDNFAKGSCVDSILNRLSVDDQLTMIDDPVLRGSSWYVQVCHDVAHALGRAHWTRYAETPAAAAEPASVCGWGYFHGVSQQLSVYKDAQWFQSTMPSACAAEVGADAEVCVHGLGHAIARRTNFDTTQAHRLCLLVANGPRELANCADGFFMELTSALRVMREVSNPGGLPAGISDPTAITAVCSVSDDEFGAMCAAADAALSVQKLAKGAVDVAACSMHQSPLKAEYCLRGVGYGMFSRAYDPYEASDACESFGFAANTSRTACFDGYLHGLTLGTLDVELRCETVPARLRERCLAYLRGASNSGSGSFIGGVTDVNGAVRPQR